MYSGGRSILRIQHPPGDPGRLWVNCYRHTNCRVNLRYHDGHPSNAEIYEWLYSVQESTREMTDDVRKDLARRHQQLARDKWGLRRQGH